MGYIYGQTDSYALGLVLLSITAALTLVLTLTVVRRTANIESQRSVAAG
jgi:NNP family nitrate/nitrite transporter-like MFS transporter